MSKKYKYRILISYRGKDTPSHRFAKQLYETLTSTPNFEEYFGKVFFSPDVPIGNFKKDIKKIMNHVMYFVIPYHKGFFDGFSTSGASINQDSITCKEIRKALKHKVKFVPVFLDNQLLDATLLKALFGNKYIRIYCANQTFQIREDAWSTESEWNNWTNEFCTYEKNVNVLLICLRNLL